jgi:hypothetical protein
MKHVEGKVVNVHDEEVEGYDDEEEEDHEEEE